ncbi:MAG: ABC transporter permease [Bacteroidales bacterium]|nr:ABC transporter permease [Bacteroidales bacterium]
MKTLISTIIWDLKLQVRNNILTIAIFVAAIYTGIFLGFNLKGYDDVLIALIYSDPAFMGFLFIGVLVLFEKSANTLQALVVTPIKTGQYLFSKAISLTLIAMVVCFAMVFAGHGFRFNYLFFSLATFLSSILFVLIGFIGVAHVNTFNQYIIIIPLFLAPAALPFLNFFNATDTYWFYIIPTQASLLLFKAAFTSIPVFDLFYAIVYLLFSIGVAFVFAKKLFIKHIIRGE